MLIYADMFTNRYRYFRFTPRTAWITFVYVAVIPSILIYTAKQVDVGLLHHTVQELETVMY